MVYLNFVAWLIIASEIAFWIVIVSGLVTRYILRKEKLGFLLLALTPVIDLILLLATSIDLYRGAIASTAHALAAIYIGVSLAFGKSMIHWADEHFRYYIMKQGAKPKRRYGMEYAVHYFKSWIRHVVAYVIGAGFMFLLIKIVNDPARTEVIASTLQIWTVVLGIDLLISISNFIWPKREKQKEESV